MIFGRFLRKWMRLYGEAARLLGSQKSRRFCHIAKSPTSFDPASITPGLRQPRISAPASVPRVARPSEATAFARSVSGYRIVIIYHRSIDIHLIIKKMDIFWRGLPKMRVTVSEFSLFGNKRGVVCSRKPEFPPFGNKGGAVCSQRAEFPKLGNIGGVVCSREPEIPRSGNILHPLSASTKKAAHWAAFFIVEIPGFEPGQTEPKSVVLPLHHISIPFCKDTQKGANPQSGLSFSFEIITYNG